MVVDAVTIADLPLEVRVSRALRSSAARRADLARRRRARRRGFALAAAAAGALVLVPGIAGGPPSVSAASPTIERCALPTGLRGDFVAAARATHLPLALLAGVAHVESRFSTDAESPAGAIGVMQLMPTTADSLHVDASEPSSNVLGGAVYLRQLLSRYGGSLELALAAYNAGPTAVDRAGGAPSGETRAYIDEVERTWRGYGSCT
jgi:soluble lytic murein transglycosylase-like protein